MIQSDLHGDMQLDIIPGKTVAIFPEHNVGLAYGAFPKKVASSIKCTLEEAEGIFYSYHMELFPGITKFREDYVLPTALAKGEIHLGLGFYIKSDDPDRDIRTLNNA